MSNDRQALAPCQKRSARGLAHQRHGHTSAWALLL
jgi:hypothetical protein